MGDTLFSRKASAKGLSKISRLLTLRHLHRLARTHHNAGYPQMAIFSHDHIGHVINVDGRYEDDYLETVFGWLVSIDDRMKQKTALDIGANIGNHSLFFSKYFRIIHAFEPNPRTFELLRFNTAGSANVVAHPRGLSDSDEIGVLRENPTNMGGTFIELAAQGAAASGAEVSLGTLDKFVETHDLEDISLIKIDTEGFEARILRGARGVIAANRPTIIFELSPGDFDTHGTSEVVKILEEQGYNFVSIEKNFQLGRSTIGRLASFCCRVLLGEKYLLRPIKRFSPEFYQMVLAVPGEACGLSHAAR